MFSKKVIHYYNLLKAKKIDSLLILIGIIGVIIGLLFNTSIINQIFAWPILLGSFIKLYDFSVKTQRDIIPYNFNNLLPAPKKKNKK